VTDCVSFHSAHERMAQNANASSALLLKAEYAHETLVESLAEKVKTIERLERVVEAAESNRLALEGFLEGEKAARAEVEQELSDLKEDSYDRWQ
jgi:hypothetical protein